MILVEVSLVNHVQVGPESGAGKSLHSVSISDDGSRMNNRKIRENTFRVEFAKLPKKPTSEEVHKMVGLQLGITRSQLVCIQLSHTDECAFVKVTEQAIAQRVVDQFDNKLDYDVKGVKYKLRLRMADGCVDVRLHDLSENTTNEQIRRHMEVYGDVLSVQELLWSDKHHFPGLSSGIRLVRMVLREPIKSYITIDGESTLVTYPRQRQTCRHCGEYLHTGISCVQNKKLLAQKAGLNDRLKKASYAGAVRGNPAEAASTHQGNDTALISAQATNTSTQAPSVQEASGESVGLRTDVEIETDNTNNAAGESADDPSNRSNQAPDIGNIAQASTVPDEHGTDTASEYGSVEGSGPSHQSVPAQQPEPEAGPSSPGRVMQALLSITSNENEAQKGKHKQEDGSTSEDSSAFTVIGKQRGRGRSKKLKQ